MSQIDIPQLKALLEQLTPRAATTDVQEHTDLFNTGLLDSLSIIQLITQLEKKFGFVFNFNDLKFENFQTLLALQRLLQDVYKL